MSPRRRRGVNCGHDLDLRNTPLLAREVPEIVEAAGLLPRPAVA